MTDKENIRPWTATSTKSKGSTCKPETMTHKGTQLVPSTRKRGVTERGDRGVRVLSDRGLNNNASSRVVASSGRAFTLPSTIGAEPQDADVDPPASTSRFQGPLRVRVENSRPRDVSLSFWSPPSFTDGGGGESSKKSSSSSAAVATGIPEATSGSVLMRNRAEKVSCPDPEPEPTSDRRRNVASRLASAHNRSSAKSTAQGKQLSTDKKRVAVATTNTGAQSSMDCGGLTVGDTASGGGGRAGRAAPFGSDISHILSWKPATRPSGTPPDEAATSAPPGDKTSTPSCRVVPSKVETPAPLPRATASSLEALRVPVASSKRRFDEGGDVDYDSEAEGKNKEGSISLGEGRGLDEEDDSDDVSFDAKAWIGGSEEANKRRKIRIPSVESSSRGSSAANNGAEAVGDIVSPSPPEIPISRGNPTVRRSSGSGSSVSVGCDDGKVSSPPDSVARAGSQVPCRVSQTSMAVQGLQEEQMEAVLGTGEGGVIRNPGVMGDDDNSDDEVHTSASLTIAAGGLKFGSSNGGGHGRGVSPKDKSSFPQTAASVSGSRVSGVPAVASGAGLGDANGSVTPILGSVRSGIRDPRNEVGSASIGGLDEKPRKVSFAHVPRTLGTEVVVNGKSYWKTAKIGRGGSSEVFRVVAPDGEMFALKIVKVDEKREEQSRSLLDSYSNEIELLKRLKGNRFIINLENAEVDREAGLIYIVLELGETDLDRLFQRHKAQAAPASTTALGMGGGESDLFPGGIEANFVRVIWQQMLMAVNAMHEQRVVHGDLKPANFVLVRGSLKLIDFGIAKAISNDTTNISRDSRLGTMNYMCPEAFEDTGKGAFDPATGRQTPVIKLGRASDIWSLGCILYQMTHGRTPFSHLDMLQKMRAITNRGHAIHIANFKDVSLVETLRGCLQRDPSARLSISGPGGLLSHPYLHPVVTRVLMEKNFAALVDEKVAAVERELTRRHESRVAEEVEKRSTEAVARAVAAEQSRQAAGLSIAKSAVKKIIAETVQVLRAEEVLRDRGGLSIVTAMVMGSELRGRGAAGSHSVVPPPSARQQQ